MSLPKAPAGGIVRTSLDNTWQTPERVLDAARAYFGGPIPFDPATAPDNPTKALSFCAGPPGDMFAGETMASRNGLEVPWEPGTWVNPPYGKELRAWLLKIQAEAARNTTILALLPCARWEQEYLTDVLAAAKAVCWVRGRVAFVSSKDFTEVGGNPYASMILGFNVNLDLFAESMGVLGPCFALRRIEAPRG